MATRLRALTLVRACTFGAFCLAAMASSASMAAQTQPVPYDTFCKLDVQSRRQLFNEVTAENRAELVRTHVERWRDANLARLTPPQVEMLKELIAFITADAYRGGATTQDARTKAKDIEARQAALFTREEMSQMQPSAPCLPKKNSSH